MIFLIVVYLLSTCGYSECLPVLFAGLEIPIVRTTPIPSDVHYLQPTVDSQDEQAIDGTEESPHRSRADSDASSVDSTMDGLQLLAASRNLLCTPDTAAKDPFLAFNSTSDLTLNNMSPVSSLLASFDCQYNFFRCKERGIWLGL